VKIIIEHKVHDLPPVSFDRADDHAIGEDWLQQLIFDHPDLLPVAEVDPIFGPLVSLCRELETPAGPVDNLCINNLGMLTLAECKLWRNPQARREVVGQILDYAAQLSRWDYTTLEQAVGRARKDANFSLYDFLCGTGADAGPEATFVDRVNNNLRRGRFLLLIVGDGIRERVEAIAEFLQQQAHLNFSFALVEIRRYHLPDGLGTAQLVVPRVLTRTVEIERAVVRLEDGRLVAAPGAGPSAAQPPARRSTITEQYFFEQLAGLDPALPGRVRQFFDRLTALGLVIDPTSAYLMVKSADKQFNFGGFSPQGWIRNFGIAAKTAELGRGDIGEAYLETLAMLLPDAEVYRSRNRFDWTVQHRDSTPVTIAECLDIQEAWLDLIRQALAALAKATT